MPATLLLTHELAASLAGAVRRGVPIETAVQAAGISSPQFYAWLRAAESSVWPDGTPVKSESLAIITAFAQQIRQAQAGAEADHIAAISDAGAVVGKSGVPEWRARAWLLNNHPRYRSTYRQERVVQQEHSGQVSVEHSQVKALTPTELEAAYKALNPGVI